MKNRAKKICGATLVFVIMLTPLNLESLQTFAAEKVNFALGKATTASYVYNDSTQASAKAVDGDLATRWATEQNPNGAPGGGINQWILVDLDEKKDFNQFLIASENDPTSKQRIGKFKIEGSNDSGETKTFTSIYESADKATTGGFPVQQTINLEREASYRYVRLSVDKLISGAYPSISIAEFQIFKVDQSEQNPTDNVASGKATQTSGNEAEAFGGDKVVDGNTNGKTSRWASQVNQKPTWVSIDLGKEQDLRTIKLFWERKNATNYEIQTATTEVMPTIDEGWKTVKTFTKAPTSNIQKIVLDETVKARHVRVKVNNYDLIEAGGTISWGTVSLYEVELYGGLIKAGIDETTNDITLANPLPDETKLNVDEIVANKDFEVTYNGTDYEQVIGSDLTIYKPLVDTKVKASFKVVDPKTDAYRFKEVELTVPGKYTQIDGDNAVPEVLPALREWKGSTGDFAVNENSKVVIANKDLKEMADTFADDYKAMSGKTLKVEVGGTAKAGDFNFTLTTDKSKGLQEEGYLMNVGDKVDVVAETKTGAYWATRTILQILKSNNNTTITKGETRDYPLYKVRGVILDVARKPFSFKWVKDFTEEMSWYKMNDFQIHLNDNYIFLEDYTSKGLDPMDAYSGFRLESSIKKGGNGGLNKADLTSTDVFYTKDEFRQYIKDARVRGVNIVPEIDTPAHSLALTKVRPDLRNGLRGRENDHLNLVSKYDESLDFVQSIFNDYLQGEDPVFDRETMVHVGADEYTASSVAFRNFCNDMYNFIKDSGRNPRVWGSLTSAPQGPDVPGEGVQMNLWNFGYANMDKMYEAGYDLINCDDGLYYIVPNAGYYGDYLNQNGMYNWAINSISNITIPAGDKQMVGGSIALWNDMVDLKSNGMGEYDIYDRLQAAVPLYAANVWGKDDTTFDEAKQRSVEIGEAPNTNLRYNVVSKDENYAQYNLNDLKDSSNNGYDLKEGTNASIKYVDFTKALKLNGGKSFLTSSIENAGMGSDLRVKVKRQSSSKEEQILFESSTGSIKAVQKGTGKVGFSREGYDYSLNYELPMDVWVEIEIKNVLNMTSLYVDGVKVDTLGDDEMAGNRPYRATFVLPIERIGSETNAFEGYVKDIRLAKAADYASTTSLMQATMNAKAYLKTEENNKIKELCRQADELDKVYNPSNEEVTSLLTQIEEAMGEVSFKKADYTEIDNLIKLIPADTSLFTKASIDKVEAAKSNIQRNLHESLQETVDNYATVLARAINTLELKTAQDLEVVDSSTLKATADSSQSTAEGPAKAIDGDPDTIWHTQYTNAVMPHSLVLELKDTTLLGGLSYLPRQSGTNGMIKEYEIQVSTTTNKDASYTTIKAGTWKEDTTLKKVMFDQPANAKFIRLKAITAVGNFSSAAEVELFLANTVPDFDGLTAIIEDANKITNNGFTEASWNALKEAITDAKVVKENAGSSANDVENAKREVLETRISLQLEGLKTDKSSLVTILAVATAKEQDGFIETTTTPSTWALFTQALQKANKVNANIDATQREVTDAVNALSAEIDALRLRASADQFKALEKIIKDAEAIYEGKSSSVYDELKVVVLNAKSVLNAVDKTDVSFEEINEVMEEIIVAKSNLEVNRMLKALSVLVEIAKAIDTTGVEPEKIEVLKKAIADAEKLIQEGSMDTKKIKEAGDKIVESINNMDKTIDKEMLSDLIANTGKLDGELYTTDSYQAMLDAISKANATVSNANASSMEIKDAYNGLLNSISNLVLKHDRSTLGNYIKQVKAIITNKDNYMPSSIKNIEITLTQATDVYNDKNATTVEIENASMSLLKVISSAKFKADKSVLEALIVRAEAIKMDNYTEQSVGIFKASLAKAKEVLENPEATQSDVQAALESLKKAQKDLIFKEKLEESVKTGDSTNTTLLAVMILGSGLLLFIFMKKRRDKIKKCNHKK